MQENFEKFGNDDVYYSTRFIMNRQFKSVDEYPIQHKQFNQGES